MAASFRESQSAPFQSISESFTGPCFARISPLFSNPTSPCHQPIVRADPRIMGPDALLARRVSTRHAHTPATLRLPRHLERSAPGFSTHHRRSRAARTTTNNLHHNPIVQPVVPKCICESCIIRSPTHYSFVYAQQSSLVLTISDQSLTTPIDLSYADIPILPGKLPPSGNRNTP
jgi:hypothetical protein